MTVLETARLRLRHFEKGDAAFIIELLNEPAFLQNIGDKGVRSEDDAIAYLTSGPLASYAAHGFGLYCVDRKNGGSPIGMCGLLKRPTLDDPDIGFAFLKKYRMKGYGVESASAVVEYAQQSLGLSRLLAITSQRNHASSILLDRIGLNFVGMKSMDDGKGDVKLYEISVSSTS